jgi:hypothetical protein
LGSGEIRIGQICAAEGDAREFASPERCVREKSLIEVGITQVGRTEVCSAKVSSRERCVEKLAVHEIGFSKVGTCQVERLVPEAQ